MAILPELERGRDRNDIHVALSRYMARRKKNEHHLGAVVVNMPPVSGTPKPPTDTRKYPARKRLLKAERANAMDNAPITTSGRGKCWDFNSNATCVGGAKFPNAPENFNEKNLHWALSCELMRRGGGHKRGNAVDVSDVDGRVLQLREQNRREHGDQMVDGERTAGQGSALDMKSTAGITPGELPEYDLDSLQVNPADPHHPCDFSVVDFTQLEEAAHRVQGATDDWVDSAESSPRERGRLPP